MLILILIFLLFRQALPSFSLSCCWQNRFHLKTFHFLNQLGSHAHKVGHLTPNQLLSLAPRNRWLKNNSVTRAHIFKSNHRYKYLSLIKGASMCTSTFFHSHLGILGNLINEPQTLLYAHSKTLLHWLHDQWQSYWYTMTSVEMCWLGRKHFKAIKQ